VSASQPSPSSLEARVCSHEWVAEARLLGQWMLVVPSATGVRVLRRQGKRPLVAAWLGRIGTESLATAVPLEWRLLETMPPPGSETEARCSDPVRRPLVSGLQLRGPGELACGVRVPYDLAIFDGHFPAIPIVPGVVQVDWAVGLARAHLRIGGRFNGITATKFRRLVQPGMNLALSLEHRPEFGELRFEYLFEDVMVSTGRVFFRGTDD
jgi:3-hydroxymyristoyl/3-hydroxydecanoyl-(acyl carrier protein) dehydratase